MNPKDRQPPSNASSADPGSDRASQLDDVRQAVAPSHSREDDLTVPMDLGIDEQMATQAVDLDGSASADAITQVTDPLAMESVAAYQPTRNTNPAGTVVADRYRIVSLLGVGGMGEVYRVHDQRLGVEVALKVLRSEMAHSDSFLQRFRNELLTARQVSHPNVVRLHDLGHDGDLLFLTMDFVEGESLNDRLEREGALPRDDALNIARQIADALAAAHKKGVVHRDLKPDNVLINRDGDVLLTDFGIARGLHDSKLTRTGEVLGTLDYLAPEQARGEDTDGRADIYALGLVLFEMLSGERAYPRGTLVESLARHATGRVRSFSEIGAKVDSASTQIVEKCLHSEPSHRYQEASGLETDISAIINAAKPISGERSEPIEEKEVVKKITTTNRNIQQSTQSSQRPSNRSKLAIALTAAAVFSSLAFLFATNINQPPQELAPAAAQAPEAQSKRTIAILPLSFINYAPESDESIAAQIWANSGLPQKIKTSLYQGTDLTYVSRAFLHQTMRELGLNNPLDLTNENIQVLLDVLDADLILYGSTNFRPTELSIHIQLQSTAKSKPETIAKINVIPTETDRATEEITSIIAQRFLPDIALKHQRSSYTTKVDSALFTAQEALQTQDFEEAQRAIDYIHQVQSDNPGAWLLQAKIHIQTNSTKDAIYASEQAASHSQPESLTHIIASGIVDLLEGRSQQAAISFQEALTAEPSNPELHVLLAEALFTSGQFAPAFASLENAISFESNQFEPWYLYGRYLTFQGNTESALENYWPKALEISQETKDKHSEAKILNAMGFGSQRIGKLELALKHLQAANDIQTRLPESIQASDILGNLGLTQLRMGSYNEAEESLKEALAIAERLGTPQKRAEKLNYLGTLHEDQGLYERALEFYKNALSIHMQLDDADRIAECHVNIGFANHILADFGSSDLNLRRALDIWNDLENPFGLIMVKQVLGLNQISLGQWTDSLRIFHETLDISRSVQVREGIAVSLGHLGQIAHLQGRYAPGLDLLNESFDVVDELGDQRGQVEFTLKRGDLLLDLHALDQANGQADRARIWLSEGGSKSQQAQLSRQRARLALMQSPDAEGAHEARTLFNEALEAAEASGSVATRLAVQLDAHRADLAAGQPAAAAKGLSALWQETRRLGHVPLELAATELLTHARLDAGDLDGADEALRRADALVRKVDAYGGTYRLRLLEARLHQARGNAQAALGAREAAREEIARVTRDLPDELLAAFLANPILDALDDPTVRIDADPQIG